MAGTISAATLAAAKPQIVNGAPAGGTNLPGAFGQHYTVPVNSSAPGPNANIFTSPNNNTTPNPVDPAAQAAAAAQAAQQAKINSVIQNGYLGAQAGGDSSIAGGVSGLTQQGEGLFTSTQQGQNTIDEARKSIGLNQINSVKDLMNTIKQGLQGTGVALGNTNALDSSAAQAAARAYGNYGNTEENKINNSAADANQQQDVNQTNLNVARDAGLATLKAFRDSSIQTIQAQAVQALASIANTVAFLGGDPSQVDMDGIKQQILQRAQDQLGAVDNHISTMLSGVQAASPDQTAQNAYAASNAGATPSGPDLPFQLDSSALSTTPANLGGSTGGSLIPLAVKPKTTA